MASKATSLFKGPKVSWPLTGATNGPTGSHGVRPSSINNVVSGNANIGKTGSSSKDKFGSGNAASGNASSGKTTAMLSVEMLTVASTGHSGSGSSHSTLGPMGDDKQASPGFSLWRWRLGILRLPIGSSSRGNPGSGNAGSDTAGSSSKGKFVRVMLPSARDTPAVAAATAL
ncbi:UNVERIFIED_CONTAM: hypothetical protein FKN15_039246 [Acipenser sinensis]